MTFSSQLLESLAVTSIVTRDRNGSEVLPSMQTVADDTDAIETVDDGCKELNANILALLKEQRAPINVRLRT